MLEPTTFTCLAGYFMDWLSDSSKFTNRDLESSYVGEWPLIHILHSHPYKLPLAIRTHALFKDTIATWRLIRKKLGQPSNLSLYFTIQNDSEFLQSREIVQFHTWKKKGLTHYYQLFQEDQWTIKPFATIVQEFNLIS